ncbi:pentapeptide repeat-containing protein [Arsenophonus nasoniae]|nr:pentapeptide repeat-containing protein [Arsenophonus nasoniae]
MESNLSINDMDVKKATSPTTILEHIIDFITFGGVKKELTKQYNEFCSKIVDTLEQYNGSDRYEIPKDLKFNFSGKDVIFSNHNGFVFIDVEGKVAEKRIDEKCFNNFCTIQLLMKREGLSEHQARLTNDGNICLANADLSNRDLSGIYLREAELHNVNLSNSDLSFSNLKGAQLQFTKFDSVCYDKQAERNTYISNICNYLKTTYQIDSNGQRNTKSNGLFRTSKSITEFHDVMKAFNEGTLNIEAVELEYLTRIILNECRRLTPIDDEMFEKAKLDQDGFLSTFYRKVESMVPEERTEFEMIIDLFSDAYLSAPSNDIENFSKISILKSGISQSLFNECSSIEAAIMIRKNNNLPIKILTSHKHSRDFELPIQDNNPNTQSIKEHKIVIEADQSHATTRNQLVKARKAFFENLKATNVNNLKQPISTGASRDVTTLREFFDNNSPS